MSAATQQFDNAVHTVILRATRGTDDDALKKRRCRTTDEGKRRRIIYDRVLSELVFLNEIEFQARLIALYDLPLTELAQLDNLVDEALIERRRQPQCPSR